MRVTRTFGNGISFEAEGDDHNTLFDALSRIDSEFDEIFGDEKCGICKSDTRFRSRDKEIEKDGKKKKYRFRERVCRNYQCRAVLSYGQKLEGGALFPKRKDKEGNIVGKWGWVQWNNNNDGGDADNTPVQAVAEPTPAPAKSEPKKTAKKAVKQAEVPADSSVPF